MPRYYFHLYDGAVSLDEEGRELENVEAARLTAEEEVLALAAHDIIESRKLKLSNRINVVDANGRCVVSIRFSDVIRVDE